MCQGLKRWLPRLRAAFLDSGWPGPTAAATCAAEHRAISILAAESVFGQRSELGFGFLVPAHSGDGPFPSPFHFGTSGFVCGIAGSDHRLEVFIVVLDDLVGRFAFVREVAWAAELCAGHSFHSDRSPVVWFDASRLLMCVWD